MWTQARRNTILSTLVVVIALLLISATPEPVQRSAESPYAASDLVRLVITNNSQKYAAIRLDGPSFYYLPVLSGMTKTFTPVRGEYQYKLYSCGVTFSGILDLSIQKRMVIPPCGERAFKADKGPNTIDTSTLIKLVQVEFDNDTASNLWLFLYGPQDYIFTFTKDQKKTFTIPKGEYTYRYFACGGIGTGKLFAQAHKVKEFECP